MDSSTPPGSLHLNGGSTRMAGPEETWLPVPGWPGYEVSDLGRVRSVDRVLSDGRTAGGVLLAKSPDSRGYMRVTLRKDGKSSTRRVCVLVAEAFLGRRPPGKQILHKDDDHSRDDVGSLSYGTAKRNVWERTRRERRNRRNEGVEQKREKRETGEIGRGLTGSHRLQQGLHQ